ncbi:MAG TPA: malectin domain-containing carbohydrate-binding protein [Terriglobales bacterium]
MSSTLAESTALEKERAALQAVLQSPLFVRSPTLAHLLSYLCEKTFAGEGDQIKEYCIAVDVFGRPHSFDQDVDSIVRVEANRLRKRLAEYYRREGAGQGMRISVPVGRYVPVFEEVAQASPKLVKGTEAQATSVGQSVGRPRWWWVGAISLLLLAVGALYFGGERRRPQTVAPSSHPVAPLPESPIGLPVGNEIRILAGGTRRYVDRSGKLWGPDAHFSGGHVVQSSAQYIWRTQDPAIYRSSRQGDFNYNIPLPSGIYELHLHFAETFYGPENVGGGGEGSRIMTVTANGNPLLTDFDVIADAAGARTAAVKVFTDIAPAKDGLLHLNFSSVKGGGGMLSGIELLPGSRGRLRPVRIVTRDVPYYSDDSHWWSADMYFKGGQLAATEEAAAGNDDPELYSTERWGNFSYAIPVTPGKYVVTLHFIERHFHAVDRGQPLSSQGSAGARVFNVFCNRKLILRELNILGQVGEGRPLVRQVAGLEPDAQGKLLLEFVPVQYYATVTAIEVVAQ